MHTAHVQGTGHQTSLAVKAALLRLSPPPLPSYPRHLAPEMRSHAVIFHNSRRKGTHAVVCCTHRALGASGAPPCSSHTALERCHCHNMREHLCAAAPHECNHTQQTLLGGTHRRRTCRMHFGTSHTCSAAASIKRHHHRHCHVRQGARRITVHQRPPIACQVEKLAENYIRPVRQAHNSAEQRP